MTSNDVFRRIRYIFDFGDTEVISIFALAGLKVSREEISGWLKKDDDPAIKTLADRQLAIFLNGLISHAREKIVKQYYFQKIKNCTQFAG